MMINKIMVPLDGSKLAECALPYAGELGAKLGAEVVLVNVTNRVEEMRMLKDSSNPKTENPLSFQEPKEYDQFEHASEEGVCSNEVKSQQYLKEVAQDKLDKNVKVSTQIICGKVSEELSIYANTSSVDLVVMSSHGRSGPSKWVRSSMAEKLSKAILVPVMVIRAPGCGPV